MPIAPEYLHLVYEGPFSALLYGRNSVDPKKRGRSVEDQLTTGRALCERFNWPIVDEFKDTGISASRHARRGRDDFEDLLTAIKSGVARIVVAYEASRYYRDLEAYVRLRNACLEAEVLLCYNDQVFDLSKREDRKATAMDALQAEDEAEGIRDRNLRTVRLNAEAGRPHGRIPFGYARRYDPDTGDLIEQYEHPVRGSFVVQAIRLVDSGESLKSVTAWLNSHPEAARPDGYPWAEKVVRYMLCNPAYLGDRVHQGQVRRKALWQPITGLDSREGRAMFNRVKKKLTDPARRTQSDVKVAHLLSCIALCGECGDHAVLTKGSHTNGTALYKCSVGKDTSLREDRMDAYVEGAILAWLANKPVARAALIPDPKAAAAEEQAAQELLDVYKEELDEARRLARTRNAQGRPLLSLTSLSEKELELLPRIEELQQKLESMTGVPDLVKLLLSAPDAEVVWNGVTAPDGTVITPGLTLTQKREAIRRIVTVRLYKASRPGLRTIEPGRIRLSYVGQPGFRAPQSRARGTAPASARGTVHESVPVQLKQVGWGTE